MLAIRCHENTALLNKFQFERNAVRENAGRYEKSRHYQSMPRKPNTPTVLVLAKNGCGSRQRAGSMPTRRTEWAGSVAILRR
jgi:hypothetical protein